MARETAKERRKRVREQVSVHRERNKDRESLLAAIAVAAPDGLEQHMSFKFETVKGKTHIVCTLTQEGAVFINDFAAKLGEKVGYAINPKDVVRELSLGMAARMKRDAFRLEHTNE